jgi:2-iminobutanoate/2-iminopropanoate deaminase
MRRQNRACATLLAACAALATQPAITAADAPTFLPHVMPSGTPPLPFSDAALAGDTLYLGGHIGIDPQSGKAASDPDTEARLMMEALQQTLRRAGLTMDDLVSVTVFCTDLKLYDAFNAVYSGYFHGHYPARAFIGASELVRGAHFEIMGVAIRASHAVHH